VCLHISIFGFSWYSHQSAWLRRRWQDARCTGISCPHADPLRTRTADCLLLILNATEFHVLCRHIRLRASAHPDHSIGRRGDVTAQCNSNTVSCSESVPTQPAQGRGSAITQSTLSLPDSLSTRLPPTPSRSGACSALPAGLAGAPPGLRPIICPQHRSPVTFAPRSSTAATPSSVPTFDTQQSMHTAVDQSSPAENHFHKCSVPDEDDLALLFQRQTSPSDGPRSIFSAPSGSAPTKSALTPPLECSATLPKASNSEDADRLAHCSAHTFSVASLPPAGGRSAEVGHQRQAQPDTASACSVPHLPARSKDVPVEGTSDDLLESGSPSSITLSCPHSTGVGLCHSSARGSSSDDAPMQSSESCAHMAHSLDQVKTLSSSGAHTIPSDITESLLPLPPPMHADGWFALDKQSGELIASPVAVMSSREVALQDASPRSLGPQAC
jgi:hypothetical protein